MQIVELFGTEICETDPNEAIKNVEITAMKRAG